MSRTLTKILPEFFIVCVLCAATLLVYHYKFVVPQLDVARRIYVIDDEKLANAKIVAMQKSQDLGLITSEDGVMEEFQQFGQTLLEEMRQISGGYPVFRKGSVILSDGVVDLTAPIAEANDLNLDYTLEQYLEDYHKSLRDRRPQPGE